MVCLFVRQTAPRKVAGPAGSEKEKYKGLSRRLIMSSGGGGLHVAILLSKLASDKQLVWLTT